MLTEKQRAATANGVTALNAAARLLNEAVEELYSSPIISNINWARLRRQAKQLSQKADVVNARAVRKHAFSGSPTPSLSSGLPADQPPMFLVSIDGWQVIVHTPPTNLP
jgi:hypothetical protein